MYYEQSLIDDITSKHRPQSEQATFGCKYPTRVILVFVECIDSLEVLFLNYVSIVCSVDMVHVCGVLDGPIVDKHTLHTLFILLKVCTFM